MPDIPFTQFMRPHGRPVPVLIARPEPIATLAKELAAVNCRFEIEELRTGEVSMTIEDGTVDEDGALAQEVVENGPAVVEAVDR